MPSAVLDATSDTGENQVPTVKDLTIIQGIKLTKNVKMCGCPRGIIGVLNEKETGGLMKDPITVSAQIYNIRLHFSRHLCLLSVTFLCNPKETISYFAVFMVQVEIIS